MSESPVPMIIERTADLGKDALEKPGKYNGFMGISILHKFYSKKRMIHYFQWASKLFKEFIIVLMDDPDQYNFMVFQNMTPDEALEKARAISDEIKRGYIRELRKLNIENIKILQFRDFKENEDYKKILKSTIDCMEQNNAFKEDLFALIEIGIGGKIIEYSEENHLDENKVMEVKKKLSQYIIEEFSSLIYFTENGYPIEIDPTKEFTTKRGLYDGLFKNCDTYFTVTKRGHLYAHPKGITKSTY